MTSPAAATGDHVDIAVREADPLLPAAASSDDDIVVAAIGKHWVPADEKEILASQECAAGQPPLLYRTFRVNGALINLYRCVIRLSQLLLSKSKCQELRHALHIKCTHHT
jgi:hypothetical protein